MTLLKRPLFLSDVEDCADYLTSEAGEDVARRWKKELDRTMTLISKSPGIGRLRHDLPIQGIRTFWLNRFPRYLIFYRVESERVELLRVKHGMMHLPGLFGAPYAGDQPVS